MVCRSWPRDFRMAAHHSREPAMARRRNSATSRRIQYRIRRARRLLRSDAIRSDRFGICDQILEPRQERRQPGINLCRIRRKQTALLGKPRAAALKIRQFVAPPFLLEGEAVQTFESLYCSEHWVPIPNCPGRYVLAGSP